MPASRKNPWLICYDIADPDRLRDVHKAVSQYALPFQYSIYRTEATRRDIVSCLDDVVDLIDPRRDDVRAYPLLTTARHTIYGRSRLAEGVLWGQTDMFFDNLGGPSSL